MILVETLQVLLPHILHIRCDCMKVRSIDFLRESLALMHPRLKHRIVKRATGLIMRPFVMRLLKSELLYQVLAVLKVLLSLNPSLVLSVGYLGALHVCARALPGLSYVSCIVLCLLCRLVSRLHLQVVNVLLLVPLVLSAIVLLV